MRPLLRIGSLCLIVFSFITTAHANVDAKTYTLNNGLQLLVVEDHRAPVVVSQVWYKVGSAYEQPGLSGLSHMLEHMMFKGSQRFPGDSFFRLITENGGRFNAATSNDATFYYATLPADKLALGFALEADRMQGLQLKQSDFATENQVVQEERRMRIDDDPSMRTAERLNAAAHLASPYHHLTIGWMDDIKHYTLDDLKQWYQQWYAPNNATLVVVGDVNADDVYRLAVQHFGALKPNSNLPTLRSQPEPPPLGPRHVTVNVPAKVPEVMIGYNVTNVNKAQQAWEPYALILTEWILTGSNGARLQKDLVRRQQIVTDINIGYSPYTLLPDLFLIDATPNHGVSTDKVIKAINKHIEQLQKTLISKTELTKVKNKLIASNVFGQDSMEAKASQLGRLVSINLPWQTINTAIDQINAVTPEQIQAVAKKYLTENRRTIAILNPLPSPSSKQKG